MPAPTSKEPYEKPAVTQVDLGNLMNECDRQEGEVYRRFTDLAQRVEVFFDQLVAFEVELQSLSEALDASKLTFAKVQFVEAVQQAAVAPPAEEE